MKKCKCGCGTIIPDYCTWVRGHHGRGKRRTKKEIENMKKGISQLERKRRSKAIKKRWENGTYDFMYGNTNPSCNPEIGKKIGEANKKRIVSEETKQKIRNYRTGKPGPKVSEETKKFHSERMKKDNPMYRKEVLKNHPVLKSGPKFISDGEKKLSKIFKDIGYEFEHQKQIAKKVGYYTVDFFFPDFEKIIEFDGHHNHITFAHKDKIRDEYIKNRYGYDTLRLIPVDLNNSNRSKLISKIKEFLK